MFKLNKMHGVIAASLLTFAALPGCSSNKSAETMDNEESRISQTETADTTPIVEEEAEVVMEKTMVDLTPVSKTVTFAFDSAELDSSAKETLKNAMNQLDSSVPLEVEIMGYTDSTGPDSYNQALSQKRAQAVKDYIGDMNLNINDWEVEGKGESSPASSNDSEFGRSKNRRASLTLTPMDQHSQQTDY